METVTPPKTYSCIECGFFHADPDVVISHLKKEHGYPQYDAEIGSIWNEPVEVAPTDPIRSALFQFAGHHKIYTWLVTGTSTQLRMLGEYGKKMTPRERVREGESWGSWILDIEPITTDTAREWIRAIVKANDFDFENWFPVSLKGKKK